MVILGDAVLHGKEASVIHMRMDGWILSTATPSEITGKDKKREKDGEEKARQGELPASFSQVCWVCEW